MPRFVSSDNYAFAFGEQWMRYLKTQLDSHTGLPLSEERLARCMQGNLRNWKNGDVKILEAGSGAGRFTEILLKHGADVHSFDYSSAVEANAENNKESDSLTLVQADIRHMPFPKEYYDYVVCLGVLQHTPSPEESISKLWEMVKPGGALVIDHYRWGWGRCMLPPIGSAVNIFRPVLLRLSVQAQFKAVRKITDLFFPIHWKFRDNKFIQKILARISPVHFYYPSLKLRDRQMYYEWALLDTHDATTDFYKHYRNENQIQSYLGSLGAQAIQVTIGGNGLEAFCRKSI
jgi:SAM-dependent methyltransferase